ncbi:MAG: hypothetical protein WC373_16790 [Smithella sp.]|jgi:phage terminase Nu1 subunit (DNA packaging protein)
MENSNKDQQPKILEMAKKRRHIFLLEKLARGKSGSPTLSKGELQELAKFEATPGSPAIVDSQEKVAKAFNVSDRTVRHWVKDGMPLANNGQYDLTEIQAWRFVKKHPEKKDGKGSSEKWEARFREMKAKLAELEYQKKLGALIPREDVEKQSVQRIIAVKRAFLGLPRAMAPQLVGLEAREVEGVLAKRINEIINDFAQGKKVPEKK